MKSFGFQLSSQMQKLLLAIARRRHCLVAESEGFEPSVGGYPTHAFQACPFDRSGNSLGLVDLGSANVRPFLFVANREGKNVLGEDV